MCGIFGMVVNKNFNLKKKDLTQIISMLSNLSETRGKDSSGFAFADSVSQQIKVIKSNQKVSSLVRSKNFKELKDSSIDSYLKNGIFSFTGHSRLVTNGSHLNNSNNQPVVKDNIVTVHNGIIVNSERIWEENSNINQLYEIDTEVFNSLMKNNLVHYNDFLEAFKITLSAVKGTLSIASYIADRDFLTLYSNNCSLHVLTNNKGLTIFASEKYTLQKILSKSFISERDCEIVTLSEKSICLVDLSSATISKFYLNEKDSDFKLNAKSNYNISVEEIPGNEANLSLLFSVESDNSKNRNLLDCDYDKINSIIRCAKCILPETFPFIEFNENGVCNFCLCHEKEDLTENLDDLNEAVSIYKGRDDSPNCIIPFSGGRDSTFTLHFAVKELQLNPITFTYDWAMVTDLARRNIARVCGKLGVENIIVAADIHKKRNYIRKNVMAWLSNPSLGMVPLFMAGDKHFFRYTQMTKERTNIDLNIWGINRLENTDFKSGFAGVKPNFGKRDIYSLSTKQKLSLGSFLGINMLKTPEYINDSLLDNIQGHLSRLRHPRKDFFSFFDYYPWNEKEINDLIINEYEWETAVDTNSTWRIGDGTASFYNYIYYRVAGFSEIDTFRSNQIREGLITRSEALRLSMDENRPRYENIVWYLKSINVPFAYAIDKINKIKTLY